MVTISGQMVASIWAIGKETLWMTLAFTLGKTAGCMKVFTAKTKSMAMESIHGLTRRNILAGGLKGSSMESEFSSPNLAADESLVFGKTVRKSVGSLVMKSTQLKITRFKTCAKFLLRIQKQALRRSVSFHVSFCHPVSFISLARD